MATLSRMFQWRDALVNVNPDTLIRWHRKGPGRAPDPKQRWMTFVRNHAKAIVACDFFVVVTAHPTAEWTLQQFRESLPGDHPYRFVIHDRDNIFSRDLERQWPHPLPSSGFIGMVNRIVCLEQPSRILAQQAYPVDSGSPN